VKRIAERLINAAKKEIQSHSKLKLDVATVDTENPSIENTFHRIIIKRIENNTI
jgi:hypothetical protein